MKPLGVADPDVKIPAAVRAAAARADEMHAAVHAAATDGDPPPDATPAPIEPAPVAPAPVAPTPAPVATTTEPASTPRTHETDWERKYNGMEGRYKRQIEQLVESNEGLMRALQQLETRVATAPAAAAPVSKLVTPEEESEFGSEFLGVVGRRAKEEISPEIEGLRNELKAMKSQLSGVTGHIEMDARQRMFSNLDKEVTDWRQINFMDSFKDYLALPDVYSGVNRHELLKAAFERNDTNRVAAFFKGFLAEEAATGSAGVVQPHVPAPAPAPSGKVPLESLAAPGRAKTAASNSLPAEKPSFTSAQISQFYLDKQRGAYRDRPAEADLIERQIFDAGREGRVR